MPKNAMSFIIILILGAILFKHQPSVNGIECYDCRIGTTYGIFPFYGPCFEATDETRTEKDCDHCSISVENGTNIS